MPKRKTQHDQPPVPPTEAKRTKQATLNLNGTLAPKADPSTTPEFQPFQVPTKDNKDIQCERRGKAAKPSLIFTHGAGGGLSNAATKDFADGFAEKAAVVSFQGNMNLTGRMRSFQTVLEHEKITTDCALGGRSMGTFLPPT